MDYHPFKAALNRYLLRQVGGDERPVFLDIGRTYPALGEVTRSYPVIRAEYEAVLARRGRLPVYHEIDPGEAPSPPSSIRISPGASSCSRCRPQAGSQSRALPGDLPGARPGSGLVQAFFSVLAPSKSVPLHSGPYLGYLRYHLGLVVPKDEPPRLRVNGQDYVWKPGDAVLFDDTWLHEVVNCGSSLRAVLIVDLLRPMPFRPLLVNRFVTRCVARPTYGRAVARRVRAYASD